MRFHPNRSSSHVLKCLSVKLANITFIINVSVSSNSDDLINIYRCIMLKDGTGHYLSAGSEGMGDSGLL